MISQRNSGRHFECLELSLERRSQIPEDDNHEPDLVRQPSLVEACAVNELINTLQHVRHDFTGNYQCYHAEFCQ